MPLTSPPFRAGLSFYDREYFIITYRTDPEAIEKILPEPLTFDEPLVKYEFIRMPIPPALATTPSPPGHPVRLNGQPGSYTHAMFLNDGAPIYGGRELWVFPRNWANLR